MTNRITPVPSEVSAWTAPRSWAMQALAAAASVPAAPAAAAGPPSDAENLAFVSKHCTRCHATWIEGRK